MVGLTSMVSALTAQVMDSAEVFKSTMRSTVEAITVDKDGNRFVAGYFKDSVFFRSKMSAGIMNQAEAMYIHSFTPSGILRFTKVLVTNEKANIKMFTDDSGNVFIGTRFSGTSNLRDGNPLGRITGGANLGFFILKLGGKGEYKWHTNGRSEGTGANIENFDYVLRNETELYYILSLKGDVTIANSNGGFGTYTGFGSTSTGRKGVLVVKVKTNTYSHATAVAKIGSSANSLEAFCLTEYKGQVFFTGNGTGTVDFDPGAGKVDVLINNKGIFCSLDSNLKYNWVTTTNIVQKINRITVDAWGNLRGFGVESGTGLSRLSFCSMSTSGKILRQYRESFSFGFHNLKELVADKGGNLYLTGTYQGTGDFDPTPADQTGSGGTRTAFLVKYDTAFGVKWLISGGSASTFDNSGNTVFLDDQNILYWGGTYARTISFSGNASIKLPNTVIPFGFISMLTECKDFTPILSPADTALCLGASVELSVKGAREVIWKYDNDTSAKKLFTPTVSGKWTVEAFNGSDCYKTLKHTIVVHPLPKPVISQNGMTFSVAGNWTSISWFINGQKQNGQTGNNFSPAGNGVIHCTVLDNNGCDGKSNELTYNATSVRQVQKELPYCYVADNEFVFSPLGLDLNVYVYTMNGKLLKQFELNPAIVNTRVEHGLMTGIYTIRFASRNGEPYGSGLLAVP